MESKLEPNCNGRGRLKADPEKARVFHATLLPLLRVEGHSPARMQRMSGHTKNKAKDEFSCTGLDDGIEHTAI